MREIHDFRLLNNDTCIAILYYASADSYLGCLHVVNLVNKKFVSSDQLGKFASSINVDEKQELMYIANQGGANILKYHTQVLSLQELCVLQLMKAPSPLQMLCRTKEMNTQAVLCLESLNSGSSIQGNSKKHDEGIPMSANAGMFKHDPEEKSGPQQLGKLTAH